MQIAYLINQYPAISHSFIRREILALEQIGFQIMRISIRGWDLDLVDDEDRKERERTRYILRTTTWTLLFATARVAVTRPFRFMNALRAAFRMSGPSERPLYVHLAYLAEACRILPWLQTAGVTHLHAHFGTNSTEVAMHAHILGGPQYSFTVHGPEEFERARTLSLQEKIARCVFVVSISTFGKAQLYRNVPVRDWPKIQIVHCGLNPAFRTEPWIATASSKRIVCVARLSPEKGHFVLLEAAARLAAQGIDFKLTLVGDGPLRSDIEAKIRQCRLADKVEMTGSLSGQQVREQILAARALVLASFAEGLPVVLMEALALRRPVIATYVAGVPELVREGESGWLVPASDVDALADAMTQCLDAPAEMIARMGNAGRDRVLQRHDVSAEAAKLEKLFRAAAAGGRP